MIDNIEVFQPHTIAFCQCRRLGIWPHVETNQWRFGCRSQDHIGFSNTAHSGQQHTYLDVIGGNVIKRRNNGLNRTLHIALNNHRIFHRPRCRQLVEQIFQIGRFLRSTRFGRLFGTVERNFARPCLILDDSKHITG